MTLYELGKELYEAYFYAAGGKSVITGALLPEWDALPQKVRDCWEATASCVFQLVGEGTFDEYRRIHGKENQSLPT